MVLRLRQERAVMDPRCLPQRLWCMVHFMYLSIRVWVCVRGESKYRSMNIQKSARIYYCFLLLGRAHTAKLNLFSYLSIQYSFRTLIFLVPTHPRKALIHIHLYSAKSIQYICLAKIAIQAYSIVLHESWSSVVRLLLLSNGVVNYHRKFIFHSTNDKWSIKTENQQ